MDQHSTAGTSAVLQASLDAYNAHDLDAYLALFAPSATFGQLGGRTLLDSRDAMRGYYQHLWQTRPTIRCAVKQRSEFGPFVVELQEISGQDLPAMQAMVIFEVREARIHKVWYAPLTSGPTH